MNVHILATVLKHELIASTLLVFKTLRAGFPTATIHVAGNDLDHPCDIVLGRAAQAVGASYANIPRVAHGAWIEFLLRRESEPFWICDGDIEFYGCVEDWFKNPTERQLFAGRYEPEFFEEWTQSQHVARLHPSLMWFNPRPLRAAMRLWPVEKRFPELPATCIFEAARRRSIIVLARSTLDRGRRTMSPQQASLQRSF